MWYDGQCDNIPQETKQHRIISLLVEMIGQFLSGSLHLSTDYIFKVIPAALYIQELPNNGKSR